MQEIWKDIPNYEGLYQVSNLGNVKSIRKNRLMKYVINRAGYKYLCLYKNKIRKGFEVHKLVAMAFLGHVPCGYKIVCDHINNNKLDNRVENIQLISNRENSTKDQIGFSSNYVGVHFYKRGKTWKSSIRIKEKQKHLGYFKTEYEAHLAYQDALSKL